MSLLNKIEKIPIDEVTPSMEYTNEDLTRDPKAAKAIESVLSKVKIGRNRTYFIKKQVKRCFYAEYGKNNPLDMRFFRGLALRKEVNDDTIVTIRAWEDLVTSWWWWFATHKERTGGNYKPRHSFVCNLLFDLRITLKKLTKDRA